MHYYEEIFPQWQMQQRVENELSNLAAHADYEEYNRDYKRIL